MIFLTVGTQLAFDRLVSTVDRWAGNIGRDDVFAQIGPATYFPEHLRWAKWLDPNDCRHKMQEATLIVAHAGMGSVLTALEFNKPILILPRRVALGEHRNDHQIATARWLAKQGRVEVAMDEKELVQHLNAFGHETPGEINKWASDDLLEAIHGFISED